MSYSIITSAQTYLPVYHPVHVMTDSSSKTNQAFSYFVDIFSADTNVHIDRKPFPKRPVTGYGLYNLAPVLKSYIRPDLDITPAATGFTLAPNYKFNYRTVFGERFTYWNFTDNYYDSGLVGFTSSSQSHSFKVGDQIIISQDIPFTNGEYEGIKTIVSASTYSIVTSQAWAGSTATEGGKIRYADGSSISYSGLASGATAFVFCAAFQPDTIKTFNGEDWVVGGGGVGSLANLLTNAPSSFRIKGDAQAYLSTFGGNYAGRIHITTSGSGVQVGSYVIENYDPFNTGKQWYLVGVGPWNIENSTYTVLSGPSTIFGASVDTYTVQMQRNILGFPASSKILTLKIDDRCTSYRRFDLLFMDKKGSWFPFTFQAKHNKSTKINKSLYLKDSLYEIDGSTITYDTKNRGFDAYNLEQTTKYVVRSLEMTEQESEYFSELVSSPYVYWMSDVSNWTPVQVEDGDFPIYNPDSGLIQYQISFTVANKNVVPI